MWHHDLFGWYKVIPRGTGIGIIIILALLFFYSPLGSSVQNGISSNDSEHYPLSTSQKNTTNPTKQKNIVKLMCNNEHLDGNDISNEFIKYPPKERQKTYKLLCQDFDEDQSDNDSEFQGFAKNVGMGPNA